jgi:hypothetical protein
MSDVIGLLLRASTKPPTYVIGRAFNELTMWAERYRIPGRLNRLTCDYLAKAHGYTTVNDWWDSVGKRKYLANVAVEASKYDLICPGDRNRIISAAERACAHHVDLLGSGEVALGEQIDWQCDYKSGFRWPYGYCSDLEYGKPDQFSDVKFPWELSRMQWLIPVGQAYLLTKDERYANKIRGVLESWIAGNPHAGSINWACTMEVALRIITLTWFFHVFKNSIAWASESFRGHLLRTIYLHADFTARHLEKSDVNGNHYTADAAGLVYGGLFFGEGRDCQRWLALGWGILCAELPRQVYKDGVDFEGSVPYHRLVQELFLLPALYRRLHGMEVPHHYRQRLIAMTRFTAGYSRPDGSVPLLGDADDARALPFGGQDVNDHRYLLGIIGSAFAVEDLLCQFAGSKAEVFWLLGAGAAKWPTEADVTVVPQISMSFPQGGFYVMRNRVDHVFANCGPLGLAGRGGHSHNDILSFEATLRGIHLISDCGAYLYTASYAERNLFRSTAYHNTPRVDREEINRLVRPDLLWGLRNDARPNVREVFFSSDFDRLVLSHTGYQRLPAPVTPVRTLILSHNTHSLTLIDEFEGTGDHSIEIPLHLGLGVEINKIIDHNVVIAKHGQLFSIAWESTSTWTMKEQSGRISPSYGTYQPTSVLRWCHEGNLASLKIQISPL